jgi:hypothetical protein
MFNRLLRASLFGGIMLLASVAGLASGSGSGGGGSYSLPSSSTPRDPYTDAYARGKSQFKKRITCKTCAYSDGVHDSVTAGKIAKAVRSGAFQLTEKQQGDLMIFLQRRYGVAA